ncbi:hypothetical protein EXIGLDRAFT_829951 [Exidia glandulosa HHB12029]|uniref:Uncharacterized protein n=1 Tax=Exidia glandulosa HHB12029 TaxID=1314781 RepID=A0A165P0H2_EXIGL|nr:hypothetical protein EXIGLDRAFT_829951 [Exidia glandulosa HHB12029]
MVHSARVALVVSATLLSLTVFYLAHQHEPGYRHLAKRSVGSSVGIAFGLIILFLVVGMGWLWCQHPQWDPCMCCDCTQLCGRKARQHWPTPQNMLYMASGGRWGVKPEPLPDEDDVEMRATESTTHLRSYEASPPMRVPAPVRSHSDRERRRERRERERQQPERAGDAEPVLDRPHSQTDVDTNVSARDRAVLEIVGHQRVPSREEDGDGDRGSRSRRHDRARSQDAGRSRPKRDRGRSVSPLPPTDATETEAWHSHGRSRSEAIDNWRRQVG